MFAFQCRILSSIYGSTSIHKLVRPDYDCLSDCLSLTFASLYSFPVSSGLHWLIWVLYMVGCLRLNTDLTQYLSQLKIYLLSTSLFSLVACIVDCCLSFSSFKFSVRVSTNDQSWKFLVSGKPFLTFKNMALTS